MTLLANFLAQDLTTNLLIPVGSLAPIFFLLLAAAFPARQTDQGSAGESGKKYNQRTAVLAGCGFLVAVVTLISSLLTEPVTFGYQVVEGIGLNFYIDRLSSLILCMVAFLGLIVTRYSINHLAGDPRHAQFSRQLALTVSAVCLLTISGNLLLFVVAWSCTSWALHQLLTFYPERAGAQLAAKKKFFISRLGDVCLVAVLILTWQSFATWDFASLFRQISVVGGVDPIIPLLLVAGALMKSAQLPFHSWLPDTMEAPTPVSALMHAGIINGGGYLVLRLSPLITQSSLAMDTLIACGGITAVLASLVMMTQSSIKRALAWSTISQMGFMMLQCGLGAFAIAALHIVAHSLYKAHAFLSTGGIVDRASKRGTHGPPVRGTVWVASLLLASVITLLYIAALGRLAHSSPSDWVLVAVVIFAASQLIATARTSRYLNGQLRWGILASFIIVTLVLGLHALFSNWLAPAFSELTVTHSYLGYISMGVVPFLLLAVLTTQLRAQREQSSALLQRVYVHAAHGFYLGTIFSRLTRKKSGQPSASQAANPADHQTFADRPSH